MAEAIDAMEVAKTLYPEAFEEEMISPTLTEVELKRLYSEKKAVVKMTMFNGNLRNRLDRLSIGYSYLLNALNHPKSFIDLTFLRYEKLVSTIAQYGFTERDYKTTGQSQNDAQAEIMGLIHCFYDVLEKMKVFFKEHEDLLESKRMVFDDYVERFDTKIQTILNAQDDYKFHLMDLEIDYPYIGQAKSNWRKDKNEGLQLLMSFIKDMVAIYESVLREVNKSYGIRIKDYTGIPVNILYMNNMNRIRRSNVYYSFLTDDEKMELEKGTKRF